MTNCLFFLLNIAFGSGESSKFPDKTVPNAPFPSTPPESPVISPSHTLQSFSSQFSSISFSPLFHPVDAVLRWAPTESPAFLIKSTGEFVQLAWKSAEFLIIFLHDRLARQLFIPLGLGVADELLEALMEQAEAMDDSENDSDYQPNSEEEKDEDEDGESSEEEETPMEGSDDPMTMVNELFSHPSAEAERFREEFLPQFLQRSEQFERDEKKLSAGPLRAATTNSLSESFRFDSFSLSRQLFGPVASGSSDSPVGDEKEYSQ